MYSRITFRYLSLLATVFLLSFITQFSFYIYVFIYLYWLFIICRFSISFCFILFFIKLWIRTNFYLAFIIYPILLYLSRFKFILLHQSTRFLGLTSACEILVTNKGKNNFTNQSLLL